MKQCPKCKNNISDTAKFCVKCGCNIKKYEEEQSTHFCPECGVKFSGGNFCPECGYDIRKEINNTENNSEDLNDYFGDDFNISVTSSLLDDALNKKKAEKEMKYFDYVKYKYANKFIIKKFIDDIDSNVVIPSNVISIEDKAFEGSYLISVTIKEGLKTIGKRAFANCKHLKKINIPNSVTKIDDEAFAGCNNLEITIPKTVQIIGNNVYINTITYEKEQEALAKEKERLDLLAKQKELEDKIKQEELLAKQKELEDKKKELELIKQKEIADALAEKKRLADLALAEKKKLEEEKKAAQQKIKLEKERKEAAISTCEKLTIIDGVASSYKGKRGFIVIPGDIIDTIKGRAFSKHKCIKEVYIDEGVKKIGGGAFLDCINLYEITLPKSLKSIENNTFHGCSNLKKVNFLGKPSELSEKVKNALPTKNIKYLG